MFVPADAPPPITEPAAVPRGARSGSFQNITLTDTWLARTGTNGFGMNDVELTSLWGLPFPTRESPLLITPGFAAHYLDGPAGADVPPRLFDAYVEFRWLPKISEQFRVDAAITTGYFGDFRHSNRHDVRERGHLSGIWDWSPTAKFVLGAAYTDRPQYSGLLPIAGVIWTPNEDVEYRLVFPAPKISRRVFYDAVYNPDLEYWAYVSGEFGGGTWAIEPTNGAQDIFRYTDWRLSLGMERRMIGGLTSQFEVGYIFNRKIDLDSSPVEIRPSNTVSVRGILKY
jgi:hypothetical protein